jgi:hypothetical protein
MNTFAAIIIAVLSSVTSASAQLTVTPQRPQQGTAFGPDPIIRVTTTFRTPVEVADPRAVPDVKAQESARRALYDMATKECVVLSETFKAECRLSSVVIIGSAIIAQSNNPAPNPAMAATAIYELKPEGSASGR